VGLLEPVRDLQAQRVAQRRAAAALQ
jgi:hypothetical protein